MHDVIIRSAEMPSWQQRTKLAWRSRELVDHLAAIAQNQFTRRDRLSEIVVSATRGDETRYYRFERPQLLAMHAQEFEVANVA